MVVQYNHYHQEIVNVYHIDGQLTQRIKKHHVGANAPDMRTILEQQQKGNLTGLERIYQEGDLIIFKKSVDTSRHQNGAKMPR